MAGIRHIPLHTLPQFQDCPAIIPTIKAPPWIPCGAAPLPIENLCSGAYPLGERRVMQSLWFGWAWISNQRRGSKNWGTQVCIVAQQPRHRWVSGQAEDHSNCWREDVRLSGMGLWKQMLSMLNFKNTDEMLPFSNRNLFPSNLVVATFKTVRLDALLKLWTLDGGGGGINYCHRIR